MTSQRIAEEARKVLNAYPETDLNKLAKRLGILVGYFPMGTDPGCCKGFFMICHRQKHITVNSDLPKILQRVVLAHELGHAVLHANTNASANASASAYTLHDMTLFDSADEKEYEANVFAAELLISDDSVLTALSEEELFFKTARRLSVPPEMLDFKFHILKKEGYPVESPIAAHGDFLKNLEKYACFCNE